MTSFPKPTSRRAPPHMEGPKAAGGAAAAEARRRHLVANLQIDRMAPSVLDLVDEVYENICLPAEHSHERGGTGWCALMASVPQLVAKLDLGERTAPAALAYESQVCAEHVGVGHDPRDCVRAAVITALTEATGILLQILTPMQVTEAAA